MRSVRWFAIAVVAALSIPSLSVTAGAAGGLGVVPAVPAAAGAAAETASVASSSQAQRVTAQVAESGLVVRGSVHQVAVLHAPAGIFAVLIRNSIIEQVGVVDQLGGYNFHNVASGSGYLVWVVGNGASIVRDSITVLDAGATPPQSLYANQRLDVANLGNNSGYSYLTTRDGVTLSVQVVLPGPPENGPYPTVMEYSGYDPSNPATGQPQYKLLMPPSGYAWVGVSIRGSGCSGGAFNFFENLQSLDGYDAIETIAAQPWSNGHVGMIGISYAGISQLFVARSRPPHLDAITPVSVIDDTWRGTLYPGGIFNNGFALNWATERVEQNKWPNDHAPGWVVDRINHGDTTCADNMLLRGQNVDLLAQTYNHPNPSPQLDPQFTYDFPHGSDSLAPAEFVKDITAKVLVIGAWQDEQTGGHWANMLNRFDSHTYVRALGQNGVHTESLDPTALLATSEFLDLYVGRRAPAVSGAVRAFAPALWSAITGIGGLSIPPDRFPGLTYDQARAAYEAEPPVQILWETGNAPGLAPGSLMPRGESRFAAWPIPGTKAQTWSLRSHGRLTSHTAENGEVLDSYRPDPSLRPRKDFNGGNIWAATPTYDWRPVVNGASLSYATNPLKRTVSMAGTGSVDLWISSTATDSDVQVTLSEILPNGQERYVQNGWLKLSHRKLSDARSTPLSPFHSDEVQDMAPLPAGTLVPARVAIFPFAHQFRAGSRIRLTIQAPGGDRPEWAFASDATGGTVTNQVAHDPAHPSRLVLPIVSGPDLGTDAAPCPSIRSQPCRTYVAPVPTT